jgi:hypothetical protein
MVLMILAVSSLAADTSFMDLVRSPMEESAVSTTRAVSHQEVRLPGILGIAPGHGCHLRQRRSGLLQGRGLLGSALGQGLSGRGNLAGGGGHLFSGRFHKAVCLNMAVSP